MKNTYLLTLFLFCHAATSAQNFSETFNTMASLNSWFGQSERFTVNTVSQLQLNDTTGRTSYLFVPLEFDTTDVLSWTFYLKQSFAGSENNQSRVYLASTDSLLDYAIPNLNRISYFLKFGEAGSNDVIRLFKESNGITTELMAGSTSIASSTNLIIHIERAPNGNWILQSSLANANSWTFENSCTEASWSDFLYFGICCKYTASNSTKFYYDDISIGHPIIQPTYDEPNYHSVVFNEIYADPTPSFGLPNAEYIELFNPSNDTLNLGGCKLINTTTEKTLPNHILLPHTYIVLCNETATSLFDNAIGIPSFTALSNAGDSLTLLNTQNEIIDIVSYSIMWHTNDTASAGGVSLERINPYLPCESPYNWASSINPIGGTPSQQNSVANFDTDTHSPLIQLAYLIGDSLVLTLDEPIDISLLTCSWNASPLAPTYEFPFLTITIPNLTSTDTLIELFVENLSDCWGNTSDTLIQIQHTALAHFQDLIINEILADPDPVLSGPSAEFIELFNTTNHRISLEGCTLNSKGLPSSTIVEPHEWLVVGDADNALAFLSYNHKILIPDFPTLTNGGMHLELVCNQEMIDSLTYSIDWYSSEIGRNGGTSLERINPLLACSSALNWKECLTNISCTPQTINSVWNNAPDTLAPALVFVENQLNSELILHFNKPLASQAYAVLLDHQAYDTLTISSTSSIIRCPFPTLSDSSLHTLTIQNTTDCSGNSTHTECLFGLINFDNIPELFINEILFNPHVGGYDFVEFVNTSSHCQSLNRLSLANAEESTPITTSYRYLLPGEYLALTENSADLVSFYSASSEKNILELSDLPAWNDDAGDVVLTDSLHQIIDALTYSKNMHFSLLKEEEGVSLERLTTKRLTNDSTNWHSASYACGFATPGRVNSQYHETTSTTVNFALDLEIFSPDNDGYHDVLTFLIHSENANQVVNLKIYNEAGFEVARLLTNENIGATREISWDGVNDSGGYLPVGIYLAVLEMFTPESASTFLKKDFVIAKKWQ